MGLYVTAQLPEPLLDELKLEYDGTSAPKETIRAIKQAEYTEMHLWSG